MLDGVRDRYRALVRRARRIERRELHEFQLWIERTPNLVHVSILVFVPLLMGVVTFLSNTLQVISFLIFPPLASGSYTLFANPEGQYASPGTFVAGLSAGGLCGWVALEVTARYWYHVPPGEFQVNAGAAALGIFLTGVVTWTLDIEQPSAFSTALLVLLTNASRPVFVGGIVLSTSIIAVVFLAWREAFYEERSRFLYETTRGDDHVLVPMRGDGAERTATFGARIAAAHEAGKVVLLDVVDDESVAAAERSLVAGGSDEGGGTTVDTGERPTEEGEGTTAERQVAAQAAMRLERVANRVRTKIGVPCEVAVVADGDSTASVVLSAADETGCDLVVTPYEQRHGRLSPFVRRLFAARMDAIAFRPDGTVAREETRWDRVMVTIRPDSDNANAMVDFADRIAGDSGHVSVCTCIDDEEERRRVETALAGVVEAFSRSFETRVPNEDIEDFIRDNAGNYDLVMVGASTDRSAASRFVSPPTFERLGDVDADVAIVHHD